MKANPKTFNGGIRCPHCRDNGTEVINSRSKEYIIMRRRRCMRCHRRFNTVEMVDEKEYYKPIDK